MAQEYNVVTNIVANVSGFMNGMSQATNRLSSFSRQVNTSTTNAESGFGRMKKAIAGVAGAYIGFEALKSGVTSLAKAMIGGNADMETYKNTLTTVMGSSKKATEMLAWAQKFAASTPFEIPDIVEATTQLETYGINAKDTLGTIGNMASVTGRPLSQAVEAIADAQTGELERLKEFGITKQMLIDQAAKMGKGEIVNAKGQITDMKGLNDALFALMKDRYKGGMELQSQTFKGMISNIKDSMGTIAREMGKPIFNKLEEGLKKVVPIAGAITSYVQGDLTNASKGLKDAFGEDTASKIINVFSKIKSTISDVKNWITSFTPTVSNLGTIFSNLMPVITTVGGILLGAFKGIGSILPPIINGVSSLVASFTSWGGFVPIITGLVTALITYNTLVKAITIAQTAYNAIQRVSILLYNAHRAAVIAFGIAGGGVNGVIMAMRAGMTALNATFLSNPIVLVVAALVGLGTAFVVAYQRSETFRNIVNGVWSSIKSAWNATVAFFTTSIPNWISGMGAYFETFKNNAIGKWNSFKQGTINVFNSVKSFFATWGTTILAVLTGPIGVLVLTIVKNWNKIKSKTTEIFNSVKNFISSTWNSIRSSISGIVSGIVSSVQSKWNSIKSKTTSTFNSIKSFATSVWNSIKSAISTPISTAYNTVKTKVQNMKNSVSSTFSSIKSIASSTWNGIKSAITTPINAARSAVANAISKIKGFFSGLKLKIPKPELPPFPHFSIDWGSKKIFNKTFTYPKGLNVDWYAKGGLFNQPSVIGVGEEPGVSEAVLPLKNSVLGKLGKMIVNSLPQNTLLSKMDTLLNSFSSQNIRNLTNGLLSNLQGNLAFPDLNSLQIPASSPSNTTNNNYKIDLHIGNLNGTKKDAELLLSEIVKGVKMRGGKI